MKMWWQAVICRLRQRHVGRVRYDRITGTYWECYNCGEILRSESVL